VVNLKIGVLNAQHFHIAIVGFHCKNDSAKLKNSKKITGFMYLWD